MADLKQHRAAMVNGILGCKAVPTKVVLQGMADLEKALERQLREAHAQRAEFSRANAAVRDQRLGPLARDRKTWAESAHRLRALEKTLRSKPVTAPPVAKKKERVFLGSIGATRVVPFDYPWTWKASVGGPTVFTSADVTAGTMRIHDKPNVNNPSSDGARAALGIFFSSPLECPAPFWFWANPAFSFFWWDTCQFAAGHSDGFIGLYAAAYHWSGAFAGVMVDQMIPLWSDSSWWWGASGSGSSRGYPLSGQFEVDSDHFYALWVWCGINDSSEGWGDISGSSAGANMAVNLPSISWELG